MSFFKQYRVLIILLVLVLAPLLVSEFFIYQGIQGIKTCETAVKTSAVAPVATVSPTATPSATLTIAPSKSVVTSTPTKVPTKVPTVTEVVPSK
jgi:hypothetical protein